MRKLTLLQAPHSKLGQFAIGFNRNMTGNSTVSLDFSVAQF